LLPLASYTPAQPAEVFFSLALGMHIQQNHDAKSNGV